MRKIEICSVAAATLALAFVRPAAAHHSFASFDSTRAVSLHGTVYRVEWTAPHMWIWIRADDGDLWGLEAGAPSQLERAGYKKGQLNEGVKLTATLHPLRDNRHGGSLIKLTFDAGGTIAGAAPQQAPVGPGPR